MAPPPADKPAPPEAAKAPPPESKALENNAPPQAKMPAADLGPLEEPVAPRATEVGVWQSVVLNPQLLHTADRDVAPGRLPLRAIQALLPRIRNTLAAFVRI
jgi:hypothetical protein